MIRICPWRDRWPPTGSPASRPSRREFGSVEHTPRGRIASKGHKSTRPRLITDRQNAWRNHQYTCACSHRHSSFTAESWCGGHAGQDSPRQHAAALEYPNGRWLAERGTGDARPEGRREGIAEACWIARGNEGWELVAVTRREDFASTTCSRRKPSTRSNDRHGQ